MRWVTTFGLGNLRPAPGTWGSLPPVMLAGIFVLSGVLPVDVTGRDCTDTFVWCGAMALIAVVFSIACVHFGDYAEVVVGKDPSCVVADETAGMALTLALMPWWWIQDFVAGHASNALLGQATVQRLEFVALAFVLFRLMDIFKPWPAYQLQNVPAGWGILLDDLVAGVYAAAAMWGIVYLIK